MLGVQRPSVTLVIGTLQDAGLLTSKYGRIRVLKKEKARKGLVRMLRGDRRAFQRLGL
jgi:Mn-dependent DtxR family transcriptional regulator